MNKTVIFLALMVTLCVAFRTMDDYHDLFFNWMQRYNKIYNGNDFDDKFKAFVKNYESIEQFNNRGDASWTQECNQYCDTSFEEFSRQYNLDTTTFV